MKAHLNKLFKAILFAMVLLFMVNAVQWHRTKRKLATFCHGTAAGTSLAAAREKALRNGFRFMDGPSADGSRRKALVTASGVMGRIVCEIEYDGDRVLKASLHGND